MHLNALDRKVACRTPMTMPDAVRAVTRSSSGSVASSMTSEWYRAQVSGDGSPA